MNDPSPRNTRHEHVVERVGRMVIAQAGTDPVLPTEPELCELLDVSRGALREAMKSLAAKGLIEVRPRTGTRIRDRRLWNHLDRDVLRWCAEFDRERTIVELNELRQAIEPAAAALAAIHSDSAHVARLWEHYLRMEDAVENRDLSAFIEADAGFHSTVLDAGGNELFRSLGHAIDAVLKESFREIADGIDDVAASLPLHRTVAAAVSSRIPEEASAAMRTVVVNTLRRIGQDRQGLNQAEESIR